MAETADTEFGPLPKDQLIFMSKCAETAERYDGRFIYIVAELYEK